MLPLYLFFTRLHQKCVCVCVSVWVGHCFPLFIDKQKAATIDLHTHGATGGICDYLGTWMWVWYVNGLTWMPAEETQNKLSRAVKTKNWSLFVYSGWNQLLSVYVASGWDCWPIRGCVLARKLEKNSKKAKTSTKQVIFPHIVTYSYNSISDQRSKSLWYLEHHQNVIINLFLVVF